MDVNGTADAVSPETIASINGQIVSWLSRYLAGLTRMELTQIDINARFDRFGIDSYQGVVMTYELGEWLGSDIDPAEAFNHPSVSALAAFLAADPRIQAAMAARS